MDIKFILNRANSFSALARYHDELFRMLKSEELEARSGDVERLEPFEQAIGGSEPPTYWPGEPTGSGEFGSAGCIEIRHPEYGWLGRIKVHSSGFYGTTVCGGNHDLNVSELRDLLIKSAGAKKAQRDDNIRLAT